MYCDICGKKMKIVPGILSFNTLHNCITNSEVVQMYDIEDGLVYCGMPLELETEKGKEIQKFSKSFIKKEYNSKNPIFIRALRNHSINKILENMVLD